MTTDKIYKLTKIEPAMYEELYAWRSDSFAKEFNPFVPCTFEEFKSIMPHFETNLNEVYSGKSFKWVIVEEGNVLAVLGMSQINRMMKTAEVSYQVNPKFRRQGIGTIALKALLKTIFENTDLRKLTALVADKNVVSCKLVEKVGFVNEGLLRKHFIINDAICDMRFYGVLREDILK